MVKDPVCGMTVDSKTSAGMSEYKGEKYYFCSAGCKKSFDAKPEKYTTKKEGSMQHHGHDCC